MADIRLSKVPSGTNQTIACTPDSRFVFDFSTDEATMTRAGDNLVFTFDDGGSVELTGFYTTYNSEKMPDFEVDGTTISGADFFTAMNEPDLMPAAGPATVTVADGARYHEYANSSLLGGLDRLGGLDLGFDRVEEPENDLYGLGMDGGNAPLSAENYGENIPSAEPEPSVPGNPDDVPTIDHNPTEPDPIDPTNPDSPDPGAIQPGLGADGGRIIVDEAALNKGTGGTGDTDHGALGTGGFNVNLHGEGGVITIGGENGYTITVDADGNVTGFADATSGNGLTVNGVKVTVEQGDLEYKDGVLTVKYGYELSGSLTHGEAGKVGADDTLSGTISIGVVDGTGDVANGSITVEVHDDGPRVAVTDNYKASVNFGADDGTGDAGTGALAVEAFVRGSTEALEWSGHGTDLNQMSVNDTWTSGDVTVTRTDAGYVFKTSQNGTTNLTVKATDADGDTATENVLVTKPAITPEDPNNPPVNPDPTHPQAPVAGIVVDEGVQPEHGGNGHGQGGTGSFRVDLNGEDGTILVGDETNGFIITVKDGQATVTQNGSLETQGVTVSNVDATLENGKWTITYEYAHNGHQDHIDAGANPVDTLHSDINITVTDASGDTSEGLIHIEVHDDMPTITTSNDSGHRVTDPTPQVSLDFRADSFDGLTTDADKNGNDGFRRLVQGSVQIFASNVKYEYAEDDTRVVDLVYDENGQHLPGSYSGKALSISQDGLGVGNSWGGSDIGTNPGTNPGDSNLAEALVIENKNGSVSYGMNLEFGRFGDGDKALITFMLTPRNNNDDTVVFSREVSYADLVNGKIQIDVPDGFTKVFISALPGEKSDGTPHNSTFTVKTLEMTRPSWEHEGSFTIHPGADGVADANNDGIPDSFGWDVDFSNFGNPPMVKIKGAPGSGVYELVEGPDTGDPYVKVFNLSGTPNGANGTNLDGNALFIVRVDPETGKWTVDQFYNFDLENGNNPTFDLKFQVTDTDGDTTQASQTVNADLSEMLDRFQNVVDVPFNGTDTQYDTTNSILTGMDANDLMYGRGGDDILFGDAGNNFETALYNELRPTWPSGGIAAPANGYGQVWTRLENSKPNAVDTNGLDLKTILTNVENAEGEGGDDALFGGLGNDILFGGAGNDYLYGNGKNKEDADITFTDKDMLFGGSGNDILVYDANDAIIHGGSDIDILLVGKNDPTLSNMLNEGNKDSTRPYVGGIEVLLRSLKTNHVENLGITSLASLATYGITIDNDNNRLILSEAWHKTADGYEYHDKNGEALISIETTNDVAVTIESPETDSHTETGAENTAHFDDASVLSALGHEGVDADSTDSLNDMSGQVDAPVTDTSETYAPVMKLAVASSVAAADTAEEPKPEGTDGDDSLMGTDGDELLFGLGGNDYLFGGEGRDSLYGGDGDDLIVYDPTDYLVQGGDGIDFLLSGNDEELHLQDLLNNNDPDKGPLVSDVEVLLKGDAIDGLTSLGDLKDYGITVEDDKLSLSGDWSGSEGKYTYNGEDGKSFTLETTLTGREQQDGSITFTHDSASDQADQELMQAITNMQAVTGGC